MVLDIKSFLGTKAKKQPMLNQVFMSTSSGNIVRNYFQGFNYKKFWQWFKTRPELYSVLSIPIIDTVGGPVSFVDPATGKSLGRNKRLRAERFWKENFVREEMKSIEFDRYLTGDGYAWTGNLTKKEFVRLRKEANRISNQFSSIAPSVDTASLSSYLFSKAMTDEDITGPRKFQSIPSSTVEIEADRYKVVGYVQRVADKEVRFSTEEVVHLVLHKLDGRTEGYSPIESMIAEMFLIDMIKKNMIAFFENGGHPSKIYSLPDVRSVSDPQYKKIIDLLKESKSVMNSNGSLVYAGKLQVDDLGSSPKDMEYKDLAMWIVSNMAFAFQIPSTRIPYLLSGSGGAVNKGDSGGVSDAGYWRYIETQQDYLEDVYNSQVFEKIGFHLRFERGNKQDKIRDTQARVQQYDAVAKVQEILKRHKKKLSEDKLKAMLDFADDDLEEMSEEEMNLFAGNPMDRQNQMNGMQTLRNEATVDRSNNKRESASNKNTSS